VAILEDASSPARVIGSGATLVTAAFTPPSNCILAAFMFGDANNGSLDEALTPTDSASGTWSTPILDNARGGAAAAVAYRIIGTSPGSMTVTLTDNKGSVPKGLNVRVLTGTDLVNPIGASATVNTASASVVSTVANSWVWSAYFGSNATVTAGANTTMQDEFGGFDSGDAIATFNSTNVTAPAGTTITLVEVGGTAVHHVVVEFVPPSVATNYSGPWTGPTPGRIGPTGQWSPQQFPSGTTYAQSLAGTLTSGATLTKAASAAKAGTLTLAGSLARVDQKSSAGALASAGTVAKQDNKALAGALTDSGALSTIKVVLRAFAGTLTSAGALAKAAAKALPGGLTPTGVVTKAASKAAAGALAAGGALAKAAAKAATGVLTAAGALAKSARKALAAVLSPSGGISTTGGGQAARATSTPAVTDRRTSTPAVTDRRTSTPDVEG
jgi:hypothetical protein